MPETRPAQIDRFLAEAAWSGARRAPLAGDASSRRYLRLARGAERAVLMDADPRHCDPVGRFLAVGDWLRARGFSAPEILAADESAGLVLMEDFGDALFAGIMDRDPPREQGLCLLATDVLGALHTHAPPGFVAQADGPALADLVRLIGAYYLPAAGADPSGAEPVAATVADQYERLSELPPVMSLRDFHAGNLIWMPDRQGTARAGLLDFQDAFATHPAYDLVSLLQDARRDVSPDVEAACLTQYLTRKGLEQSRFSAAYALLGAQRALRILAVFARLAARDDKPGYLVHMDRVWSCLERNLRHPALAPLASVVRDCVPPPDDRLRAALAAR